jgi:hypothetical protein
MGQRQFQNGHEARLQSSQHLLTVEMCAKSGRRMAPPSDARKGTIAAGDVKAA